MVKTSRIPVAIVVGVVGGLFTLLMADTVWALTSPFPTSWRYFVGGLVGISAGWQVGGAALALEKHLIV